MYENSRSVKFPERFISLEEGSNILAVAGAKWFVSMLESIPDLKIDSRFAQEDWGVAISVSRTKCRFWIGLSDGCSEDGSQTWIAHFHNKGFQGWRQSRTISGKREFEQFVREVHQALSNSCRISELLWYEEKDYSA